MRNSYWWRPLAALLLSVMPRGFCQAVARRMNLEEYTVRRWVNGMAAAPAAALRYLCAELPEEEGRRLCYAVLPSRYQLFDQTAAEIADRDPAALMVRLDELTPVYERELLAALRGGVDERRAERLRELAADIAGFVLGCAQVACETRSERKVA